ncbi:MAG: tetratricopeptide repeat protein [Anaerolineaceae bacterium]|nr:MAG: tetratricopeptide repeat protein [Anaerolineaceae bacterium]
MAHTALDMAQAFLKAGELDDALDALDAHLQAQPDDDAARRLRARLYNGMGRTAEALADYSAIKDRMPEDFISEANALVNDGQSVAAIALLRDAHRQNREYARLADRLIRLLMDEGDISEARSIASYMIGATLSGYASWGWWVRAADLAMMDDDPHAAAKYYSLAIRHFFRPAADLSPMAKNRVGGWFCARAAAHSALNVPRTALKDYRTAAELIPDDASIRFQIGVLTFQHGEPAEREGGREMARDAWRAMSPVVRAHALVGLDPAIRDLLELD